MRTRIRRSLMGLSTVLGIKPRGFFVPYRYAERERRSVNEAVEEIFRRRQEAFGAVLRSLDGFAAEFARIGGEPPPAPRWEQDWFPRLDAAVAYALVRTREPGRIVEVGSGHSTRFLARAVADGGLATRITAIDPAPRADIAELDVDVVRETVQKAPISGLVAGDFLMVDSSHIAMPGTDVDLLVNRVLPALPAGVVVHFHDVFLPDPYPASWDWRAYNEQLCIAPLVWGGAFEVLFASRYVATRMAAAVAGSAAGGLAMPDGAFESSLWLKKL